MIKFIRLFFLFIDFIFLLGFVAYPQQNKKKFKTCRAVIHRPDGNEIPFTMLVSTDNEKPVWIIRNAAEHIELKNIRGAGDTLIAIFPVFESQFHLSVKEKDVWKG